MSTSNLSLFFKVTVGSTFTGTPVDLPTKNDLDAHGVLLDLPRLPSELGVDYYKRLRSVFPLRGGAHQEGLVHAITRELGLEEKPAFTISPLSVGGRYLAPSPRVDITSTKLTLYSAYWSSTNYTIDLEVDIFDHGEGYLISDLITELGSSEYFEVALSSRMTGAEKSNGLIPSSSTETIYDEIITGGTFFFLDNPDIIPGTLYFEDQDVFDTEVSPSLGSNPTNGISLAFSINTPVINEGQYFVDYEDGTVRCYQSPRANSTCTYSYKNFPWQARWSPVAVYNLREEEYREKVFEDEAAVDDSTKDGLVTDEGRMIYSTIFRKSPSMWGE